MKADIHPKYDFVVFKDGLTGTMFLSRSTLTSKDKVKYTDGKEYPLITVEISSDSHPFFTGTQQLVDTVAKRHRDPGVDRLFELISKESVAAVYDRRTKQKRRS